MSEKNIWSPWIMMVSAASKMRAYSNFIPGYHIKSDGQSDGPTVRRYRWWKKSCKPVEVGSFFPVIYKVLDIPCGAGFLPSTTVCKFICPSFFLPKNGKSQLILCWCVWIWQGNLYIHIALLSWISHSTDSKRNWSLVTLWSTSGI